MNILITAAKAVTIKNLINNKKAKQIGSLYVSMIIGILLGIGVSVATTRLLDPHQFGDLKFLQSLFSFAVIFPTLGIFYSGSTLLAQDKNENIKHQLIGNLLIYAAVISAIFIIGIFIFSFFQSRIFNNQLGETIRVLSPLLFIFPLQICLENIMQGDNRIYELSIFRLSPQICYLLSMAIFNFFIPLSTTSALAIQLITFAVIIIIAIVRLQPTLGNMLENLAIIWKANRTYGFPVYLGAISGVATSYLGGLAIGYFIDNTNVGLYALAQTVTLPLAIIPTSAGTALYKEFANVAAIPKKATAITLLLSMSALLFFFLIIKKVVLILYPIDYLAAVPLSYGVAIGSTLRGFGDYFNRFLGSHGRGKQLRNGAVVTGVSNVVGYIVLIYYFGVKGAVITNIVSYFIYLSMMYFYYIKFRREFCTNKIVSQ
jgi:O-antigen/teichoic acid export membrane protein